MSRIRRSVVPLALTALAFSFIGNPVSASGHHTFWVDDDGKAGPSDCAGTKTARRDIQNALDLTAQGDTVNVCPGVYRGSLHIDRPGVTLRSVKPHKAVIRIPVMIKTAIEPAGDAPLISVAASSVSVIGFKVSVVTVECYPTVGIYVNAVQAVSIRGNQLVGRSDGTSRTCGLVYGILLLKGTGVVAGNSIRNYGEVGLYVSKSGLVHVTGNTVVWAHGPQIATSRTAGAPAGVPSNPAISIENSRAQVIGNHVAVADTADVPANGGILLNSGRGVVQDNVIEGFDYGLSAGYGSRGSIIGNVIRNGKNTGLLIYDTTLPDRSDPVFIVEGNRVRGFLGEGIRLSNAHASLIRDNDFTGNPGTDCVEEPTPKVSTWKRNLGNESTPTGLCKPPA